MILKAFANIRKMRTEQRHELIYGLFKEMKSRYPKLKVDYLVTEIANKTGYKSISHVYKIIRIQKELI